MLLFLMTVAVMIVIMLNITIYGRPAYQMQTLYFCLWLLLFSFFFPRFISAIADWISAILAHMVWP